MTVLTKFDPTPGEVSSGLPADFILARRPQVDEWNRCRATLFSFLALEDDWNCGGAAVPSPLNVYSTIAWLQKLQELASVPPPEAVPGMNGEVSLVWQGDHYYLEAEISSPDRIDWMLAIPGQTTRHWKTPGPLFAAGESALNASRIPTLSPGAPARRAVPTSGALLTGLHLMV